MANLKRIYWAAAFLCVLTGSLRGQQEVSPGGEQLWESSASDQVVAGVGSVQGVVVDVQSGQPVVDASITLRGDQEWTTRSDLRGRYQLRDVPAGEYRLIVFKGGYQFAEITAVVVEGGRATTVNAPLEPRRAAPETDGDVFVLATLTVTADTVADSESVLLYNRRRSISVTDAVSEDRFSVLGIGDAAQALAKTVGTTIVDGKYAVIRGLGDRYTNTRLNGLSVPSADPDRLAVQLDQFPADLLESVITSKTFTADQPGAFSGGSVDMRTKSFPDKFFIKFGLGVEYNTQSTGKQVLNIPGGGRDWLGKDDGTRALGRDAPADLSNINRTLAEIFARRGDFGPADALQSAVELFDNRSYYPTQSRADPNVSWSLSLGDRFDFGREQVFGYVAAITYDRKTGHYENGTTGRYSQGSNDPDSPAFVDLARVFSPDPTQYTFYASYLENPLTPLGPPAFGVTRTANTVDWGAYAQLAYKPSRLHEFNLRFFHNQSAEESIKRGVGEATRSDSGEMRENIDLMYTERGVTSVQLAGESVFGATSGASVQWRAAVSDSYQDQPDYRSMEFKYDFRSRQYDPSGVNAFRFFRRLDEDNREGAVDVSYPIELSGEGNLTLKTGGFYSRSERSATERRFVVLGFRARGDTIPLFPQPVGVLARTSDSVTIGTYMQETPSNASYLGERTISAGYFMADWRINYTWRMVAGARLEKTEMSTEPILVSSATVRPGLIDQNDLLPHVSLVYSINDDMNLRFAYGSTLARPTFRELADITLIDPFTDERIAGNPDLEMTSIRNYDLRWEWFPSASDVIAVSLFYKTLDKPIELTFVNGRIQPQNVEEGKIIGIELEYRQSMGRFLERLQNVTLGFNFSYIDSEVTIPDAEFAAIVAVDPEASQTRELFGQSPYIFNVDVTWLNPDWGTTVSVVYNISGKRLDLVTTGALPDVYEQPFAALDLIVSQRLSDRWSLKFSAKNLLDPLKEKTLSHNGVDYVYEAYRRGRTFALSVAYQFD